MSTPARADLADPYMTNLARRPVRQAKPGGARPSPQARNHCGDSYSRIGTQCEQFAQGGVRGGMATPVPQSRPEA